MNSYIPVSIVIFLRNKSDQGLELWMQERREDGPLNGLWEFPGGKIEANEDSFQAGKREVLEEVGVDLGDRELPLFITHPYEYNDRKVCLYVHLCQEVDPPSKLGKWWPLDFEKKSKDLDGIIPPVNHHIIDELLIFLEKEANIKREVHNHGCS